MSNIYEEAISNLRKEKPPTTVDGCRELLRRIAEDFNGGFHPDDDPSEIVYNGDPLVFPDEDDQAHYRDLNMAMHRILGEAGEDIYDLAMHALEEPHKGHRSRFTGAWFCDTCSSPYCNKL
jgi:hypothetical protein